MLFKVGDWTTHIGGQLICWVAYTDWQTVLLLLSKTSNVARYTWVSTQQFRTSGARFHYLCFIQMSTSSINKAISLMCRQTAFVDTQIGNCKLACWADRQRLFGLRAVSTRCQFCRTSCHLHIRPSAVLATQPS